MVAMRYAACDLQIDDTVTHSVSPHALVHHDREGRLRHRHLDAKFIERALETSEVESLIDDAAAPHLAHFIDAVGELVAAILYMDGGRVLSDVTAVHICNA